MSYAERKGIKLALAESGEHLKRVNERLDTIEKVNYSSLFSVSLYFLAIFDILSIFRLLGEKRFEERLPITNLAKVRSLFSLIYVRTIFKIIFKNST